MVSLKIDSFQTVQAEKWRSETERFLVEMEDCFGCCENHTKLSKLFIEGAMGTLKEVFLERLGFNALPISFGAEKMDLLSKKTIESREKDIGTAEFLVEAEKLLEILKESSQAEGDNIKRLIFIQRLLILNILPFKHLMHSLIPFKSKLLTKVKGEKFQSSKNPFS